MRFVIEGAAPPDDARMVVLASTDLQAENSLGQPARVAPVDSRVKLDPADLRLDLQPQSVTVARLARVRQLHVAP